MVGVSLTRGGAPPPSPATERQWGRARRTPEAGTSPYEEVTSISVRPGSHHDENWTHQSSVISAPIGKPKKAFVSIPPCVDGSSCIGSALRNEESAAASVGERNELRLRDENKVSTAPSRRATRDDAQVAEVGDAPTRPRRTPELGEVERRSVGA